MTKQFVTTKTNSYGEFSFRAEGALTESAKNTVYLELRVSAWRSNRCTSSRERTTRLHPLTAAERRAGPCPGRLLHISRKKTRGPRHPALLELTTLCGGKNFWGSSSEGKGESGGGGRGRATVSFTDSRGPYFTGSTLAPSLFAPKARLRPRPTLPP